jgi:hypothetical protein
MALSDAQLTEIARKLAQKIFVESQATAHTDLTDLKAAVNALDTAMDATFNQGVVLGYGTTQVKLALLDRVQNAAPNLTVQHAGIALAYWALREVGLL